jgi:aldehyde:ferredoxin oxidoreductase
LDFYTGNVLRIDLSTGTSTVEPLNMEWAERYIGGKGLLIRYLWDEVKPGIDALAPENPILFVTGPLGGTNVSTASRLVVGAKSPVTGMLNDSYVGGSFAPEMKFAGYDIIIVTGKAAEPTVVCIKDDVVELRPAAGYWGMKTSEIEAALRADFDADAKVVSIGPAGENEVAFACVSTDQYHKAGRGGHGWLMGSKNLKAIAVRGTGAVPVGDARAFLADMRRVHAESVLTDDNLWANEEGTPVLAQLMSDAGCIPTRNWSAGAFEEMENISSDAMQKIKTRNRACCQCSIACRQWHEIDGVKGEGPEYETIALCGANCGVGDISALMKFNAECDEYALDSMSCGDVVALAMDLTERGVKDFGLRFGEVESYVKAPGLIATRSGIGAELALGARALATKYGHPELAMEAKNLELPGYDPRGAFGMSLSYATSDRGGCHMRTYPIADEVLSGDLPPDSMENKPEMCINGHVDNGYIGQNFSSIKFSAMLCDFWAINPDFLGQLLRHVWARDFDKDELLQIGERIWNLGRLFNLREGVEPDTVPAKLLDQPFADGPSAGKAITSAGFDEALQRYYSLRGWDEKGVPSEAKLAEVGVDVRL